MGCPHSSRVLCYPLPNLFHRYTEKHVSQVTLNPVQLTMKMNSDNAIKFELFSLKKQKQTKTSPCSFKTNEG